MTKAITPEVVAGNVSRTQPKAHQMNTTTNATRKTSNGLTLPESFPLVNQREALRALLCKDQNDAILDLCWQMESILKLSYTNEFDNTAALDRWSHAETAFADAMGQTWEDAIQQILFDDMEEQEENRTQNRTNEHKGQREQEPGKVQFPGLPAHSEIELTNYVAAHPFRMVQGDSYANAFKGACSSRRAGLQWDIWAKRMQAAGLNSSLIAYIVLKVYGMDSRELVAYKNR